MYICEFLERPMIARKIQAACKLANLKLKPACELAKVPYGTLYNQMKHGRPIPFTTVLKLSVALQIPIEFFAETNDEMLSKTPAQNGWQAAEMANADRAACSRAGFHVTTDHILDWYRKEGGQLRNWEWFADQVDLYQPIQDTDAIMHPIRIGSRSTTAERLMLSGNRDFYKVVGSFDDKVIDRAMRSHKMLDSLPYVVSDEEIDVFVKGQRVTGGYRKVTMRVTDPSRGPVTAIFSKLTWLNTVDDMAKVGRAET